MERVDWKKAYDEFINGNRKGSKEMIQKLLNTKEEIEKDIILVMTIRSKLNSELEEIEEAIKFIKN